MEVSSGMAEFFGEYRHSMDAKGRLAIPARILAAAGTPFYISVSEDKCLNIYSREEWQKLAEEFKLLIGIEKRDTVRRFYAATQIYETTDKQGRIVLTTKLRKYADLEGERSVVIAGAGQYAEIWDEARWDELDI